VIIDKDHAPKWSPATVAEVDDAAIEKAFAPLDSDHEMTFLGE